MTLQLRYTINSQGLSPIVDLTPYLTSTSSLAPLDIFCFHPASGSILMFKDFAEEMGKTYNIRCYGLEDTSLYGGDQGPPNYTAFEV